VLSCDGTHCYSFRIEFTFRSNVQVGDIYSTPEAGMTVAVDVETRAEGPAVLPPSMVERMTLIVDSFDSRSTLLNLEQIACRTHLPRSTAHRILDQLVRLNWLDHTSLGYRLGRRALGLGGQDGTHGEIRQAAADILHELHLRTGMVVHLAVLDGSEEIYLDKIGGQYARVLPSRVGLRRSAYLSTGGRAMLAWLDPEQVDGLVGGRLTRPARPGKWDIMGLHRELNRIRGRGGISIDRGEYSAGVPSVAAAVRGHEGPVAAVSMCSEGGSAQLDRVVPLVAEAVRAISHALLPSAAADAPRAGRWR
jgi:DNA-binding IclR family transcriptional regulator